jgi:hypothetical protein
MALFDREPSRRALPTDVLQAPHVQHGTALNLLAILWTRQEAEKRGIKVDDAELEAKLSEEAPLRRFAGLDAEGRAKLLAEFGLEPSDLTLVARDTALSDKLAQALLDELTEAQLWELWKDKEERVEVDVFAVPNTPSSEELTAFEQSHAADIEAHHRANPEKYVEPLARQVRILQAAPAEGLTPQAEQEARAKLERWRAQIKDLPSFEALAKAHSTHPTREQGGALGLVVQRQRPEAFRVPVGQASEVLQGRDGLYLLYVEAEQGGQPLALTPPLRREIAASLLRSRGPTAEGRRLSEALAKAWKEAGDPSKSSPALDALLEKEHLRRTKGLPFDERGPEEEVFVPGVGRAPPVLRAVRGLTAKAPISAPIFWEGQLYVLGLKKRGVAERARFEKEKDAFARDWKTRNRASIIQARVEADERRAGLWLDLAPVAARYGRATRKPTP